MRKWRKSAVRRSRVRFLALVAGLVTALGLSACSSVQKEPEPEETALSLWYYWDSPAMRQCLLKLVDEFNAAHEGIEIEARYVPDEDFKKELALSIADGEPPDLAIVDSSDVQYYNDMCPLADVSGLIEEEQYLPPALASCRGGNGEMLGLPLGLNCLALYYNEDILADRGIKVPESMDEFVEAAVQATSDEVYGCAFPSLQSEESMFCFLPVLWAEGGEITDINSEAGRKAFDVLRQLVKERGMSHQTVNMTLSDITREFAKGNIAMMFGVSGKEQQIYKINPRLNFKVAPLPAGEKKLTVIGGEVLTMVGGEHRYQAADFVRFMSEPERIKSYLEEMTYLAPRDDLLNWQMKEYPQQQKYAEYLKTGRVREFTPYWPAVSMAAADMINQVILEEDQTDALERLEKKIESIREAYYEKD